MRTQPNAQSFVADKCTPELKEAYEFVLRNYRAGDHVL